MNSIHYNHDPKQIQQSTASSENFENQDSWITYFGFIIYKKETAYFETVFRGISLDFKMKIYSYHSAFH